MRGAAAALVIAVATACSPAPAGPTSPAPLAGAPAQWLLRVDQLPAAGFTRIEAPHDVDATTLAHGDATLLTTLHGAGLQHALQERFFRPVGDLALSTGPVDVLCTVAQFADAAGAQRWFARERGWRMAQSRLTPVSTGPIGDAAWADQEVAQAGDAQAAQLTLTVRLDNAVDQLALRGRAGAVRIGDAITLMRILLGNENPALAPPTVTATPSPSASPSPS